MNEGTWRGVDAGPLFDALVVLKVFIESIEYKR
jgi:hypothetical protein